MYGEVSRANAIPYKVHCILGVIMILTEKQVMDMWQKTIRCATQGVVSFSDVYDFAREIEAHVKAKETQLHSANLDLNGKLIKKGLLVSWHGYRGTVLKVSRGRCLIERKMPHISQNTTMREWHPCDSVQVVRD